ncbi:type II secretion system F family protein [Gardnerella vaginalis]|uniref:type II secretion system F family protein n=1 Tax=Gardnerella vaginalis TaxID=2702 RepID=UPI001574C834|nr:pilus assembly protein [Gardnerella vaginalis]NSX25800.1 pilus assembly protein [Gardnerella vaginalis]
MSIEESLASLVASLKSGASFESIISVCSDCNANGDARKAYNKQINAESILKWIDSRLSESTIESSLDSSFKNAKNIKNYKNAKKQKDIRKIAQSLMSVYKLSNSIGCPMADCVQAVADSYYANKRVDDLSAEVFAMPKATIKLLIALPFLSLLTGQLLGANPILMIFTNYKGYTLLSVGMAFYAVGVIWVARILKNSRNAMQSASFNGN